MQLPARVLIAVLVGGALWADGAAAQSRPAPRAAAPAELGLQHTFPLAGETLLIVVDGLSPGEHVAMELFLTDNAPPSVTRYVVDQSASPQRFPSEATVGADGAVTSIWIADERGRVVFSIPLVDPADVDREIHLQATRWHPLVKSARLSLHVQPPMIVLPGAAGLQRISLLSGAVLQPAIPGVGGLRGLALSDTGQHGYLLRDGGRLEVLAAHQWDAPPLAVHSFDPAADTLAAGSGGGAAFLLARPDGEPFTPAASLLFLHDEHEPLLLEPMGQPVTGRRVALTDDGLTAFVAEDDLIVREVNLQTGTARGLITAGLAGDSAITDLLMAGRRLLVATRGPLGRRGALTVFDLDSGALDTLALQVDPLRFVALENGFVLVVPAAGGVFQVVESGVPTRLPAVPGVVAWLDAVPSGNDALLLAAAADGQRSLWRFQPLSGVLAPALDRAPAASRLAGAGGAGPVLLLGDPAGSVHAFDPASGVLAALAGVIAAPQAAFVVLP